MSMLTIVASIRARAGRVELVRDELVRLIGVTRGEAGCVQYDLHQDNEDPSRFLMFENWESREQWRAHMEAPHLRAFLSATEGAIDELSISEMTRIG